MALCRYLFSNIPLHNQLSIRHCRTSTSTTILCCSSSSSSSYSSSSSMDSPPQGYRQNVGICLINPSKKIFAASRLDIPDSWQMPQLWMGSQSFKMFFQILKFEERFGHLNTKTVGSMPRFDQRWTCLAHIYCKEKTKGHPMVNVSGSKHGLLDFHAMIWPRHGGIDEGEDARIAAIRELREETGVTSAEVLAEVSDWLTYDFPPAVREKLKRQWGSDWKGQAQKWFLLKFLGNDDEINLLGDGKEKPEFGKWAWMSPEQVVELAVEFKRPVYEKVFKAFAPHLQ
ncbi:hypothetical protein KSS87_006643 [Heliosperma pusillum]|nr:hypothetical protein KSS87_006643 [Heliosperma pusillum]